MLIGAFPPTHLRIDEFVEIEFERVRGLVNLPRRSQDQLFLVRIHFSERTVAPINSGTET